MERKYLHIEVSGRYIPAEVILLRNWRLKNVLYVLLTNTQV